MCSAKQRSCLVQLVVNVMKSGEIVFDSVICLITAPKQLVVIIGGHSHFHWLFNWSDGAPAAEEVELLRF